MIAVHISNILKNIKKGFKALIPIFVLIIYTIIGGIIFMTIEGPNELYELELNHQNQEKLLEVILKRIKFF